MGKVVEEKKKKGRPSLLDLQKRSIKEQQQKQHQQNTKTNFNSSSNPNYTNTNFARSTPIRRSTRRHPDPDLVSPSAQSASEEEEDEQQDVHSSSEISAKKLNDVFQLYGSNLNADHNEILASNHKKRKINEIGDGSTLCDLEKEEKAVPVTSAFQGGKDNGGPSTPLPDKQILSFILDKLQKKDTYGVFSEPVDPNELPDYHELIECPMDFATVRQKLAGGAYACLEQFEEDVFLICSNAMQYNSPDTIYFRQARTIQELAKKDFESFRQGSDNKESGFKIPRRGRPPKYLKKPLGGPSLERAGIELSDATLATRAENLCGPSYDLRKGTNFLEKSGPTDSPGMFIRGSRSSEAQTGWSSEHKFERKDDPTGSTFKGVKQWMKQFVPDESRRNTYIQGQQSVRIRDPSVLATFDREKKMLLAVGLHSEHGYARSLSRFAANLGYVAWNIASNKIGRSLPAGVNFGPGWVGENDVATQRSLPISSPPSVQLSPSESFSLNRNSTSSMELKNEKLLEKQDTNPNKSILLTSPSTPTQFVHNKLSVETSIGGEGVKEEEVNISNNNVGVNGPRPPFQIHHSGLNGHMRNLVGPARQSSFNLQGTQRPCTISRKNENNSSNPVTSNRLNPEEPSRQKAGLVQPDLNIRFQSPGSPSSSSRVELMQQQQQPDLALQL